MFHYKEKHELPDSESNNSLETTFLSSNSSALAQLARQAHL